MFHSSSALRCGAAAAAAAALTVGVTGVASATTAASAGDGNDVSVTYTLDEGEIIDSCVAALTTPAKGAELATSVLDLDIGALTSVLDDEEIIVLTSGASMVAVPTVLDPSVTVTATDVPPNLYVLFSYCLSSEAPTIDPYLVGDPLQAGMGSIDSLSADGGLGVMSSALGDLSMLSGLLGGA